MPSIQRPYPYLVEAELEVVRSKNPLADLEQAFKCK